MRGKNKMLRKFIAALLLNVFSFNVLAGGLQVDPNSRYNTGIDRSQNGIPVVNISTPNGRGVSINEFLEYNVGREGQVLNNADNIGRSRLAGIINANPNLGPNQAANLILLQVNGANRSQIEGYIEALSRQKVNVILSNGNGIYLNGAGTINIRNFIPTTGRVKLKDGDVIGIDVEKGRVVIGADGFDATNTDYVNVIAKAMELRGKLVGNRVDVTLGENTVDSGGAVTSGNGINSVAIDASNLGSMYAGQVKIVSTDRGAGVNSSGLIYSRDAKLEITADGKINVAKIKGNGIEINGSEYSQTELASSDKGISVNAAKIRLAGETQANEDISLNGNVESKSDVYTGGSLNTLDMVNSGKAQASKAIQVSGRLDNSGSLASVGRIAAAGDVRNDGEILTNDDFTAKNIASSGKVSGKNIQADDVANDGKIIAKGNFKAKKVKNTKEIAAVGKISTGDLETSGNVRSNGKITVAGKLENSGNVETGSDVAVSRGIRNSGTVLASGKISAGDVDNGGKMLTNGMFTAKNVKNAGNIASGNGISAKKLENSGTVATNSDISASDSLVNKAGGNIEGKNVDVAGPELRNAGKISAGNVRAKVGKATNTGQVHSGRDVDLDTRRLSNAGEILAANNVSLANAAVTNSGRIASNNKILLDSSQITNTGEILSSDISMQDARKFDNAGTVKGNSVILTAARNINLAGNLHGQKKLIIAGKNITNNGNTTGTGLIQITSNDFTNNRNLASGTVVINGQGNIVNNAMITGNNGEISGSGITNNDLIVFEKSAAIQAQGLVKNSKGRTIYGGGTLKIDGQKIFNDEGELLGGDIILKARKVTNNVGTIQSTGDIAINSSDFQNLGRVSNLDKYEKYYETWKGEKISEADILKNWETFLGGPAAVAKHSDDSKNEMRGWLTEQASLDRINGYPSLIFKKYPNLGFDFLNTVGKEGEEHYYTGTARVPEIPLKGKLKSNATTEHGKVLAGGNITVSSASVKNRDSIISGGGLVGINASNLENSVTLGNAVQLKDGQEVFRIRFRRGSRKASTNSWFKRKLVNGDIAYEAGQPSIIEGSAVRINAPVIKHSVPEADGKIISGSAAHGASGSLFKGTVDKGVSSENGTVKVSLTNPNIQVANNMSAVQAILNAGTVSVSPPLGSAMFTRNMTPGSKYLLETRSKYVNLSQYYGSDYFLSRVGYSEIWDRTKRLGDAYYESQLLTRALAEKLGTAFINGKSNQELIRSMMDNASAEGARLGLAAGQELTQEQIDSLDGDIIWYVTKKVDGVEVLAPQVYLSKNTRSSISDDTRNKVGGIRGTYVKTKDFVNDGTKWGNGGVTYVEANTVRNETATNLLSEISGDRTFINAVGNIENIGGRINGEEAVALISEKGDVINNTTKRNVGYNNGEYDRTHHEEVASIGAITSKGAAFIKADSYNSTGGMLNTDHLALDVSNVNLNALSLSGEDKFGSGGSSFSRYSEKTHLGAGVAANTAGGKIGNLNLKGSSFIAEDTAGLTLGNIRAESVVNTYDTESRQSSRSTFSSGSSYRKSHTEENSASNLMLGKNAVITGNVEGIGSNIVLGENTYVGGKVTTDSRELHNSYYEENKKKGFSGGISHGTASLNYGKSQSTYDEKSTVNAKSNLQVGNGSVLNRGAEITATNFEYGNIQINNGDVKYGARIDTRDVHTESKSSSFGVSIGINSPIKDRIKQAAGAVSQVKNGDTAGGAMEAINAAAGTINGLALNQGSRQASYDSTGSVGKEGAKDAMANSNFYANIGVNAGFTRSQSSSSSHTEGAAVTTLKPMDENSSITYSNVNSITYQGTQAQGGTFIYNNVANIQKEAVELHNSYSSSSSSRGINAGATIGYGHKIQTTGNGGSISSSRSSQNTVETIYANGNFNNVNEVHNNTGSMVLNSFNQEGGKVTGNIGKVEVISRQNTSTTTGSSRGISVGVSANGVPSSVNISGSRTNGDRAFVDNQSTFIIGEGSNLHVGTLENTGAVVGKEGNSTFKIDSYIGKDIQNHDTMKTTGGSLGISTGKPRITNVGFNQDSRDKQGIARNTVVGDVEIVKAEGSPINRDLGKANEVTRDTHSSTNINVESQTIEYLTNPAKLREDIGKAKDEIEAIGAVAKAAFNTISSKEKNGFLDFLRTERVQETVRNLGYIDTKGKTKEQIAQEMQDKYGEIFAKNGKKLEINFYVNSEVSQDDPDAKNKMNAAGFTAEDGSIWLNADNISSMNNFDLNSVFAHEGTHKVTGKNTELLADFGQSRAEKFINKSIDKGYLARNGGGLDWEDGNLTEEQKQRLAEYTDEDIQFRMLTGDDRIDRRVNVNPNAGKVNYHKQLNEVGRLERTYKKIDDRIAGNKRISKLRNRNNLTKKQTRELMKATGDIYTEELRNSYAEEKFENVRAVDVQTLQYLSYLQQNPNLRKEHKGYSFQVVGMDENWNYIISEKLGNPEEKVMKDNKLNNNYKGSLDKQYQSTMKDFIKNTNEGTAVASYGFLVKGYGVTTEGAEANRISKTKALGGGAMKTITGGYRTVKGGGLVTGGIGSCVQTIGGGCLVAGVGLANIGFGISDGAEGIQELGYAFSSKGNTLTTGNAITEFEKIKNSKNPQFKNGIKPFNLLKNVMGEDNYDYGNMASAIALPYAMSYNSIFNSPRSTGNSASKSSEKDHTLNSSKPNWNFNSEIPKTVVKNSEGNYTLGRNNEWSVNNTVTSVKKMETSGLNDVYKVEINNGITPNYAIVNGQNFLTMKEYNNIATKMSDSIKPLNAIKDPVLNVETVREYLADNSYIKSKFLKENKLTVAIGKITLSDGTTENVIAVNGWDGKVWKNGKIPNTISIETMDNQIFKVIKDDNPSLKKFDNWNHAEKKIASYAQDNYSGKISKIEISVQNNSLIFPGMCEGCNKSMFDFYQKNPKTDITIYEGTTGKGK